MTLTFSNGPYQPGHSPWRLNTFLLKSLDIVAEVQSSLSEFFTLNKGSVSSSEMLWCAHKGVIRGIRLQNGARGKKKRQQSLHTLLNYLKLMDRELKISPSADNKRKYFHLQDKLRTFYLHEYERSLNRLKMNYYSQDDRAEIFLGK